MKKSARSIAISCAVALSGLLVAAQTPSVQEPKHNGQYYEQAAYQAYRAKDLRGYLSNLQTALALRPNHPRLLYNLAGAYALNGQPKEALASLGQVAAMGLDYPADKDDDLASIKVTDEFKKILARFAVNRAPMVRSAPAFTIHEKGMITEGIAFDPVTRTTYVGSVHQRKIISIDPRGIVRDFATAENGLWGVFGMKVDAKRRQLWACTSAVPQMKDFSAEVTGRTALVQFDLRTGKLMHIYALPAEKQGHLFGDLTISAQGDVYATDSVAPEIYVLRARAKTPELFFSSDKFLNLQGLDFTSDGRRIYVSDYATGIFALELATKKLALMPTPPNATLLGIDGLYRVGNALIGVQNGVNPERIIRLRLSRDGEGFVSFEVLEANHPAHDDITLGVPVGRDLYYNAAGQWYLMGDDGKFTDPAKLVDAVILRLPLDAR